MITEQFLSEFRVKNEERKKERFSSLNGWSISEWKACLVGEVGEAANIAKKMKRAQSDSEFAKQYDLASLRIDLGKEIADIFIYADLIALEFGHLIPVPSETWIENGRNRFMGSTTLELFALAGVITGQICGSVGAVSVSHLCSLLALLQIICEREEIDFCDAARSKFNETSEKVGSTIKFG